MKNSKPLKRARINDELSNIFEYPLTIVEAPMGYGKTTAVKSFFESENVIPRWISFRNSGNPGATFWDRFAEEISRQDMQAGTALHSIGLPADAPQLEKALSFLDEIELTQNCIIVIDDYHYSHDPSMNKFICEASSAEINKLHFVIITRDTTELEFVELLSKNMCYIVSQPILQFTETEIRDYCESMAGDVSESDQKKISEYTGGWISFIYLIILGLQKGMPVGMNETIEELIEHVLFSCYEQNIQDFLLKLSLMDEFTVAQAEYVTQTQHTKELMKQLHRENAFIFYDEASGIYKIHNVLLDFLRLKQNFSRAELCDLYERMGDYYLKGHELSEAYLCFFKAGQIERVLACLNDPANASDNITAFDGATEIFQDMPEPLLLQYPIAYLQLLFYCIVSGRPSGDRNWIERLDDFQQYFEDKTDIDQDYKDRIHGEILIVRKFTFFNHLRKMRETNDEVIRLFKGQRSYITVQENPFTFNSPHYSYIYFRDDTGLKEIAAIASEGVAYSKFSNGCGTGADSLAAAEYALETGDWKNVEFYCSKSIADANSMQQDGIVICAKFSLIRYRIYQGKIAEVLQLLKEIDGLIERETRRPLYAMTDMAKGYVYACLGQQERTPYWLQTGDMSAAQFYYQGIGFPYLVYGKNLMAQKKYAELEIRSEQFVKCFSPFRNQLGFIHNDIFKAVAKYNTRGAEAGTTALEDALKRAEKDLIVMPFIEYAPDILDMMKTIVSRHPDNEYYQRILQGSLQYGKNIEEIINVKATLTPREREVLQLTAQGLSRKEISERLFISDGTTKTHLKNIYQKLEVSGKIMAVSVAQAQNLIDI